MPNEVRPDPIDDLPALEAGEWADEKHGLLREYVSLSSGARGMWFKESNDATYIELFSGPGRIFYKGTDRFADGSPLVAFKESAKGNNPFSHMHLGDASREFCDALGQRLKKIGPTVRPYPQSAEVSIIEICKNLSPYGLHFAFLDPYNIESLPFSIIEQLSRFRHMDVLIHVSAMDLQRNLPRWTKSEHCPLDEFAPKWRQAVGDSNPSDIVARGLLLEHWLSLIENAGFQDAEVKHLVRGETNQPLYWLVLIAKHKLALKFWKAITSAKDPNYDMFRDNSGGN